MAQPGAAVGPVPKNARKPAWVRSQVMRLATHGLSCRQIEALFNRRFGAHLTIGKSWVAEFLKVHAAEIAQRRKAMRRQATRPFPVNHTWALDLSFFTTSPGMHLAMLGILDHGSRRLLCLKQLPRKCALALLGYLLLAMARHGLPKVIRTDNEAMFTSRLWQTALRALGIRHRRSQPGCPWQNGRIERLFGTLKPLLQAAFGPARRHRCAGRSGTSCGSTTMSGFIRTWPA